MIHLNFPSYSFNIRQQAGQAEIFDPVRKRYVALTPEEWVRQHVIQYILKEKGFPAGLVSVEGNINLYKTIKRYDVCAFDRAGKPLLVIECKGPEVALNQAVVDQIVRYNMTLQAPYLLITNGLVHVILKKVTDSYKQINEIPDFVQINTDI